jgi:Insertion element 4 transposase N-terminal
VPDSATPVSAHRPALFAAGHLGELTWQIPVELVDAVLAETNTTQRRLRALPSRVGVYFVLALSLFPGLGYRKVWAKLTATFRARKTLSNKAFRDLRRRIGAAPMRTLFEVLAGPVAAPGTPGVRYGAIAPSRLTGACRSRCPTPSATGPGWASSAPRSG